MERICDPIDIRLLDDWQRDLPLNPTPFATIGSDLGIEEADVLERLSRMFASGRITRVGATCAPNTVSASTLAAVAAPQDQIEEVADIIGQQSGVNHSYLRENHWNLWFVATGPDREHIDQSLRAIGQKTGLRVLDLRLVRPFNIDLGFRMTGERHRLRPPRRVKIDVLRPGDRKLLQKLTSGMPLVARPFEAIGQELNVSESTVIERISVLQEAGVITRFGVIVRHRALGWRSNAMVVWDIDSKGIDTAGPALAKHPGVTLCYERNPVEGIWPYRLYCMIHARSRSEALETLEGAANLPELAGIPYKVLFSNRCFKQTGALISTKHEVPA